jgi:superfamily I DNA and RNA helicase
MIEKNINETLVKKEPAARSLLTAFYQLDSKLKFTDSTIYHQFPIYPESDGISTIAANVIFMSREHGVFIFQCIECSQRENFNLGEYELKLAEVDRLIFSKILKESPNLQKTRRSLKFDITPLIYLNNFSGKPPQGKEFDIILNDNQLEKIISDSFIEGLLSRTEFRDLKASIEGSKAIPKHKDRKLDNSSDYKNSKGAILSAIENEIYNFDLEQKRAALFIVDGAQRIRGLAGSGKTVILAMKAAIIHLQNPDAIVLYTYYTKSLNDIVKNLITRFYRQFADRDPNWDKILIMHAWGGRYIEGVYYNACKLNNIPSINLSEAKSKRPADPFDYVCEQLNQINLIKQYDYCLMDEAQDFPPNFYRICRKITKRNRVVWAYDDFQNILNIKLQNEKKTFGKGPDGNYYIDFSKKDEELQDIVLHKCYRNPRKILITAFSLGLGIYNKSHNGKYHMIQRLENNEHWESLGFNVEKGDSSDGSKMIIGRPENNNAIIKDKLLDTEDIIKIYKADEFKDELDYIVESILEDLKKELNPEDISVICMDNLNVKVYFNYIEKRLNKEGIKSFNLLNVVSENKFFKVTDHVTLSTIYRAKGNESGSIYIAGIDSVFSAKDSLIERNKIFTAMTRSLGWVTLTGVGDFVDYCRTEVETLQANNYKLKFTQPSEKEVITIRQEIDKRQKLLNKIERIADDLVKESGVSKDEIVDQLKLKFFKKK